MPEVVIGGSEPPQQTVDTGGGTYNVELVAFTPDPVVTFVGPGTYNVNIGGVFIASYTVVATNGAVVDLNVNASLGATNNLVIDGNSTISFGDEYSAFTGTNVDFTQSHGTGGGTLILPPGKLAFFDSPPVVSNFSLDDNIDFASSYNSSDKFIYTSTGPNSGTLSLTDPSGNVLGTTTLLGNYAQGDFSIGEGPGQTTEIVCNVACFLRGTMILTASGEALVESLQVGDLIQTLSSGPRVAKAIRLRSFTAPEDIASAQLRPIRIAANALGENMPRRDLYVSPDHSMFLEGVLVPAHLLVNGMTITQPANEQPIDYFHIEVEPHDILVAEGAATESYLDIGNRAFSRPGVVSLFANAEPKTWDDACAPLVLGGAKLVRIRARLMDRALALAEEKGLARVA